MISRWLILGLFCLAVAPCVLGCGSSSTTHDGSDVTVAQDGATTQADASTTQAFGLQYNGSLRMKR